MLLTKLVLSKNKIQTIKKKESACQAYDNLSKINHGDLEYESIWNSLDLIYKFSFQIEVEVIISNLALSLIQLIQTYYDAAKSTLNLLENVESSLNQKCSLELVSIPVFTNLKSIDIDYQQKLIDQWIGYKIIHWGNSYITVEEFENNLFKLIFE